MAEKRLLVVDDVPEMGEVVGVVAEGLGYDVEIVHHASDFINRIDGCDPTTIVLDIVMPDIDGFELVKWLRDRGCGAKIIVASTGNLDYAKLARSLGRDRGLGISVVEKPYEVEKLQEALA